MRAILLITLLPAFALAEPTQIDWQRARALHQRVSNGETLSPEDQKYYDEAKRQRAAGNPRPSREGKRATPPPPPEGLVPLTDKTASYKDKDGGLYGGGSNEPPAELASRTASAAKQIQPLNAEGKPASDGKIVLLSIGMSNTTQEFSAFKRLADADSRKAANVVIVDGAQGGKDARSWSHAQMEPWSVAERRISSAGAVPQQAQALWIKQAIAGPREGWPAATDSLRELLGDIVRIAREKYPNLRLIFLSSRTYAGYATTSLNPEPYAYESAFAVRDLIRKQSSDGPPLLWGPYLWTNGDKGRALDEFKWMKEDTAPDGTHPSDSGRQKIAQLLLGFFTSNACAKPWFTR
jgi:hypothetical protein